MPDVVLEDGVNVVIKAPQVTVTMEPPTTRVAVVAPTLPVVVMQPPDTTVLALPVVGPPGPQGPPGSGDGGDPVAGAYTHTQAVASTVWDISHPLGYRPAGIRVEGSDGDTYWPRVEYLSADTVRLHLPESINGTAYFS